MKLKLLNDMMIFVKVAEYHSFTLAADDLGIAKSVVSKHIARLEKTLGSQLLQRSTRKLTFTEAGMALYQRIATISRDVEEAELAVSYTQEEPRGTLRVAAPVSFGQLHLAPAAAEFLTYHPDLNLQIFVGSHYLDLIEHGLDMALRTGDLTDSNLIARRLAERPMMVCASPEYLQQHGIPKKPSDLLEHNCLLYDSSPTGKEWHFESQKGTFHIPIKGSFTTNSSQTLARAAVEGLGVVMLPEYMLHSDIKTGRLQAILTEYCTKKIAIHAVYPHTRHLAPKVRVFIDFLVQRLRNEEYWR